MRKTTKTDIWKGQDGQKLFYSFCDDLRRKFGVVSMWGKDGTSNSPGNEHQVEFERVIDEWVIEINETLGCNITRDALKLQLAFAIQIKRKPSDLGRWSMYVLQTAIAYNSGLLDNVRMSQMNDYEKELRDKLSRYEKIAEIK